MKLIPYLLTLTLLITSCRSVTEVAYFSDAQRDSAQTIVNTYQTTVHPGDLLYIYISSQTPESTIPFNQDTRVVAAEMSKVNVLDTAHRAVIAEQQLSENVSTNNQINTAGYLVDGGGCIILPVLGKMNVAGLSIEDLQGRIEERLKSDGYINDAVVTVSPMNFWVSVVGEVASPQELHITGNRLTILEALAMCGDLTMDAQRDNVVVLRSKNGVSTPIVLDLTKKSFLDSDGYYLQTNDIVYVEPNDLKKRRAVQNQDWPKYVSFWVAVGSAVVNVGRATARLLIY